MPHRIGILVILGLLLLIGLISACTSSEDTPNPSETPTSHDGNLRADATATSRPLYARLTRTLAEPSPTADVQAQGQREQPVISSSTLTPNEQAQRQRWQQALTYWNLLNSFKDTMTAQLDDGVVDAQEAETYCFTWSQWVKHMEDSLAHVHEFKRLEPEFAANEPILIKLEIEATDLLALLHEFPC